MHARTHAPGSGSRSPHATTTLNPKRTRTLREPLSHPCKQASTWILESSWNDSTMRDRSAIGVLPSMRMYLNSCFASASAMPFYHHNVAVITHARTRIRITHMYT